MRRDRLGHSDGIAPLQSLVTRDNPRARPMHRSGIGGDEHGTDEQGGARHGRVPWTRSRARGPARAGGVQGRARGARRSAPRRGRAGHPARGRSRLRDRRRRGRQGGGAPHRRPGRGARGPDRPAHPQREHARSDPARPAPRHAVRSARARVRGQRPRPVSTDQALRRTDGGSRGRHGREHHVRREREPPTRTGAPTGSPRPRWTT